MVIIILFQRACTPTPLPCPDGGKPQIVTVRDTQYITKTVEKPVYKPGPTIYIPGRIDTLPQDVDTLAILKDYYATRIYNDTIAIDTLGFAYVKDTVSKNEIVSRGVKLDYKIPVIKETTTITIPPKPKAQLYIGVEGLGNKQQPISYFGPALVYKTKKDAMYTLGAGYSINQGFGIKAGMLWKIKLK